MFYCGLNRRWTQPTIKKGSVQPSAIHKTRDKKEQIKRMDNIQIEEEKVKLEKELLAKDEVARGLVEEIKTLRQKNQELEAIGKPKTLPDDVTQKIAEALEQKQKEDAKKNWQMALERFKSEFKEFHPDNDPAGIKFAIIEKELQTFNTSNLYTVEEQLEALKKAKRLTTQSSGSDTERIIPNADSPREGNAPKGDTTSKLSVTEQQLIKQMGWTEARYEALKAKQPSFVAQMLNQANL